MKEFIFRGSDDGIILINEPQGGKLSGVIIAYTQSIQCLIMNMCVILMRKMRADVKDGIMEIGSVLMDNLFEKRSMNDGE